MTDKDQTVIFSLNGNDDLPGRLEAFDDFSPAEDRPATLATGLVSLSFIKAALKRTVLFWCALGALGLLIGVGVGVKYPAAYKASTTVLITYGPNENPTGAILDNLAIAQSRSVAQLALSKLGLHENLGSFAAATAVNVLTDRVLQITVSAPSSGEAVRRDNAMAAAFLEFRANQLKTGQQLVLKTLNQQLSQARKTVASIDAQISQLSAQPPSAAGDSQLRNLKNQLSQANTQLEVDQQTVAGTKTNSGILTAVTGSVVLDPATPLAYSRLKYLAIYAVTGLVVGLAVGMGIVVVRTIVSDRLRRRDDVTHALGAPVKLSVGTVRASRLRLGRPGLAAAEGGGIRQIAAHLRGAVPASATGPAALAVVPADDPAAAALAVASLALSRAQEGRRVVVADLASGAPLAALLNMKAPGVRSVTARGAELILAVPGRDDIAPTGPIGHAPAGTRNSEFTAAVDSACASADLLLTLATVISLGAEHLASWAGRAVVLVTAGRSSWTRIHAVGEMIRLSGISLVSAVLVGADRSDESLGVTPPGALTSAGDLG